MAKALKAITGLIGKIMPKAPKLPSAIPMPDTGSPMAKLAVSKKMEARRTRGREGTIYSAAYGGTNLGGTA